MSQKDEKKVNKEIEKMVDSGFTRKTAIAAALDKAGYSKEFNSQNTRKEEKSK